MARINATGSAYRVKRGKAEIAREAKWQKSAKLATKKRLESKTLKPEETPGPADADKPDSGKAAGAVEPKAPDKNKGR
jgi:hypothetical protein